MVWGHGNGEKVTFDNVDAINQIEIRLCDADQLSSDDLIGKCHLHIDDVIDHKKEKAGRPWIWNSWRVIRESTGEMPPDLMPYEREQETGKVQSTEDTEINVTESESDQFDNPLATIHGATNTFEVED